MPTFAIHLHIEWLFPNSTHIKCGADITVMVTYATPYHKLHSVHINNVQCLACFAHSPFRKPHIPLLIGGKGHYQYRSPALHVYSTANC